MVTKAELEQELADLKQQLAERKAPQSAEPAEAKDASAVPSGLADVISAQGINVDDIDALWTKISEELDNLPLKKPLLTAVAAFGLGFVLGRMSK